MKCKHREIRFKLVKCTKAALLEISYSLKKKKKLNNEQRTNSRKATRTKTEPNRTFYNFLKRVVYLILFN